MKCDICGSETKMTAKDNNDNLLNICKECLEKDRQKTNRRYTFSCAYKD